MEATGRMALLSNLCPRRGLGEAGFELRGREEFNFLLTSFQEEGETYIKLKTLLGQKETLSFFISIWIDRKEH